MDLTSSARLCRLCLCSSKRFIDVMEENGDLGFIVAKTIEDLLQFKVQKVGNFPWLACSTCLEKLIDFKLFKSRCVDSIVTFEKRFCQLRFREKRPQNDRKVEPNGSGNVEKENELEGEEADVISICQVQMQADTPDHLASGPTWHNNCSNAGLKSCEKNPDDQRGDMDIEEGDVVKEEPYDVDEMESPHGQGRSLEIKGEPQDMEENGSTYPPEVPGICRIDTVLSSVNTSVNSHSVEPHESENEGRGMAARVEKRRAMVMAEESSNKLGEGDHHIVEGFYCVFCTAVLDTEKHLRDHIAKHEEGRWRNQVGSKCPTIGENVEGTYPVALVNSRPLKLSTSASGNSNKLRTNSVPFHPGHKASKCTKCFRRFSSYQIMKRHKRSCEARIECFRCKKTFTSKYYLVGHLKAEKSNEVFSCPKCPKSFNYKCELKAHRQVHSKVFVCKDCQCVFDRYYSLKEHILTHCKVKPLVCKDCQGTFIGSHTLRKHRLEVHNGRGSSVT